MNSAHKFSLEEQRNAFNAIFSVITYSQTLHWTFTTSDRLCIPLSLSLYKFSAVHLKVPELFRCIVYSCRMDPFCLNSGSSSLVQ